MRFAEFVEINPRVNLEKGIAYPFVEMENVTPGSRYVRPITTREYKGGGTKFCSGDTLFARITPCLENGKITQFISHNSKEGFGSTEFFIFRARENISIPSFVYYLASTDIIRGPAVKSMTGASGRQRAELKVVGDTEIPLFTIQIQHKIASILSAYDDLIENNNRRIKILEEMAQAIYVEWFVNFRFPGHEKVKMVKSKMGMIPKGWEVKEMQEVADVIDCLHSKKPTEIENGSKFLLQLFNIGKGGKLDLSKKFYISDEDYELWTRRIEASEGDCVITNIGRIAAVAQIPKGIKAALGRNMTAVRAIKKFITPTYLIQYLLSPHMESEVLKKTDRGTIMDSLNVKNIVKLSINIPTSEIMEKFDNAVKPIRRRIELIVNQNMFLRKTRDLLLPKLISGEIDVEDMDVKVIDEVAV